MKRYRFDPRLVINCWEFREIRNSGADWNMILFTTNILTLVLQLYFSWPTDHDETMLSCQLIIFLRNPKNSDKNVFLPLSCSLNKSFAILPFFYTFIIYWATFDMVCVIAFPHCMVGKIERAHIIYNIKHILFYFMFRSYEKCLQNYMWYCRIQKKIILITVTDILTNFVQDSCV